MKNRDCSPAATARPATLPHLWVSLLLIACLAPIAPAAEHKDEPSAHRWYEYRNGLGAAGYDLVAYFKESRATRGKSRYAVEHAGQRWLFSSKKYANLFRKDPDTYLPAYGSHCAFGASRGYLVRGDPQAWSVHKGKLYLNYSKGVRKTWKKDPDRYIALADKAWLKIGKPKS